MDYSFQDRIDEYLIHPEKMSDEEIAQLRRDIESDSKKKEQYELTKIAYESIVSRQEKLNAISDFKQQHEGERGNKGLRPTGTNFSYNAANYHEETSTKKVSSNRTRKLLLWCSSIAAIMVFGFFAINVFFQKPSENTHYNIKPSINDESVSNAPSPSVSKNDSDTINLHRKETIIERKQIASSKEDREDKMQPSKKMTPNTTGTAVFSMGIDDSLSNVSSPQSDINDENLYPTVPYNPTEPIIRKDSSYIKK